MAASTVAVASGAAAQQASQSALATLLAAQVDTAFAALDVSSLKGSLPELVKAIAALVQQFGRSSATTAARFYAAERKAAGVPGKFTVRPAPPVKVDAVNEGVRWATRGLWSENPDIESARSLVGGVAERAVLDTGRTTLLDAVRSDRKAIGWARVAEPGCCAFCALLTTRGMTYRSEHSAQFQSHNNCRCHVEPVFNQYEPSAQVRGWQSLYRDSTKDAHGTAATVAAFRKAFDAQSQ